MTRAEVLDSFKNNEVKEGLNTKLLELEAAFQKDKEQLFIGFKESFLKACKETAALQAKGVIGEVSYIIVTMLQTEIKEKNFIFPIKVCNELWWLDKNLKDVGSYDAGFVFEYFNQAESLLQAKRKRYIGKTIPQDVENIMRCEAQRFMRYVARIGKYRILELTDTEEFQQIAKGKRIEIHVAEYMDFADLIYREETEDKDENEILEKLSLKKRELLNGSSMNWLLKVLEIQPIIHGIILRTGAQCRRLINPFIKTSLTEVVCLYKKNDKE